MPDNTAQKVELTSIYKEIGIARFFGRVGSGIIDSDLGYQVIQEQVAEERKPVGVIGHIFSHDRSKALMANGFPDFVFNSPQDREALSRVFSFEAEVYDLTAYEASSEGAGKRIWAMIEAEREHQVFLAKHPNLESDAARFGYALPKRSPRL